MSRSTSAVPAVLDRPGDIRPLTLRRSNASDWSEADEAGALGGLRYRAHGGGGTGDETEGALHTVPAQRLLRNGDWIDAWHSAGPLASGSLGGVRWRHNGCWLHGAIDLPERPGEGLEAMSHEAYAAIFAALRQTGFAQLQRIWNYLPHINAEVAGMERYRQFNVGRQRAFIEDGRDVNAGLPAACALGTQDDHLRIRFLAAHTAAVPVENPRQVSAYRYPATYGPRAPSFSRAALVDAGAGQIALLISGTASIVDHASVHAGDVQAQTRETLANLQAVIAAAHRRSTARFSVAALDCTVYVRRPADAVAIRDVLAEAVGAERAASALYLQADVCRSELLVEIEAQAFAPGVIGMTHPLP